MLTTVTNDIQSTVRVLSECVRGYHVNRGKEYSFFFFSSYFLFLCKTCYVSWQSEEVSKQMCRTWILSWFRSAREYIQTCNCCLILRNMVYIFIIIVFFKTQEQKLSHTSFRRWIRKRQRDFTVNMESFDDSIFSPNIFWILGSLSRTFSSHTRDIGLSPSCTRSKSLKQVTVETVQMQSAHQQVWERKC